MRTFVDKACLVKYIIVSLIKINAMIKCQLNTEPTGDYLADGKMDNDCGYIIHFDQETDTLTVQLLDHYQSPVTPTEDQTGALRLAAQLAFEIWVDNLIEINSLGYVNSYGYIQNLQENRVEDLYSWDYAEIKFEF